MPWWRSRTPTGDCNSTGSGKTASPIHAVRPSGKAGFPTIGPGYFGHVTTAVLALGATDDQMAAVGKLTHLESLFVPGSITDNGLIHLEGLSELRELTIASPEVGDDGMVHVGRLPRLESLALRGTKTTDAGLEHLAGLTTLRTLILYGGSFTEAGLVHLERMNQLEQLDYGYTRITDAGMSSLVPLKRVKALWLRRARITDAGMSSLEGLTELTTLEIEQASVGDRGLAHLKPLTRLAHLYLESSRCHGCRVGAARWPDEPAHAEHQLPEDHSRRLEAPAAGASEAGLAIESVREVRTPATNRYA